MYKRLAQMQHANDHMILPNFMDQFAAYFFLHPWTRLFIASGIAILNFWILVEDPIAHSNISGFIPIVGQVFALLFTRWPSDTWLCIGKLLCGLTGLILGCLIGKLIIHQRCLRRSFTMFHNDQGCIMVMFWTSVFFCFLGSTVYNSIWVGDDNPEWCVSFFFNCYCFFSFLLFKSFVFLLFSLSHTHITHLTHTHTSFVCRILDGDLGVTNENWSKLAGIGCWTGDFLTMFMVLDMMLQDSSRYPDWCVCGRKKWKGTFRIATFWIVSPIGVTLVLVVIAGSIAKNGMSAWDQFNQNKLMSNELSRCFLCSIITVMDLFIVMQDWDFPEFDNDAAAINLPGVGFDQCKCNLNACFAGKQSKKKKVESSSRGGAGGGGSKVHPSPAAGAADTTSQEDERSRFKRLGLQMKDDKAYNLLHGGVPCKTAECSWITAPGVDFCTKAECKVPWHHVVVTGKWFNYGIIFMVMIFDAIMVRECSFLQDTKA